MNPKVLAIRQRIDALSAALEPLKKYCHQYLAYCSAIDTDDTLLIAHRPWVAPLNYLIRLYPPAKKAWFAKYSGLHHGIEFPPLMKEVLTQVNGFEAVGLSFFGMPPSMLESPPVLDRSRLQCLDIGTANKHWKYEYRGKGMEALFHFGGRDFSESETMGYFLDDRGRILGMRKNGDLIGEWSDITSFLSQELPVSEKFECASTPSGWWAKHPDEKET